MKILIFILNFYSLLLLSNGAIKKNANKQFSNYNPYITSKSLNEYVDRTVDPCDNFYKFSCGNWIKEKEKLVEKKENSSSFEYSDFNTNIENFLDDAVNGKYDNYSLAIKAINIAIEKCDKYSGNKGKNCALKLFRFGRYAYTSLFLFINKIDNEILYNDYIFIEDMIKRIKNEFRLLIDEKKDLFDEKSKDNLSKKLNNTKFQKLLDFFDIRELTNLTLMENCYKSKMPTNINNIEEILSIIEHHQNLSEKLMSSYNSSKPFDAQDLCTEIFSVLEIDSFFTRFVTTGAIHHKFEDKVTITADALKEPSFSRYFPHALNYGNIGFFMAHEIVHGFDSDNYKFVYDKYGNATAIVSQESKEKFEEKSDCFIKQYNAQKEKITGLNINGTKTLAENIADNGGIKIAHRAYMKYLKSTGGKEPKVPGFEDFTSEQLFFISLGRSFCNHLSKDILMDLIPKDVHSPGEQRVIVTLSNYAPFSKAFKCKLNSPMNPKDKCELWLR